MKSYLALPLLALTLPLCAQVTTTDIDGSIDTGASFWPKVNANTNAIKNALNGHLTNTSNPHLTTAAQVGAVPDVSGSAGDLEYRTVSGWVRLPAATLANLCIVSAPDGLGHQVPSWSAWACTPMVYPAGTGIPQVSGGASWGSTLALVQSIGSPGSSMAIPTEAAVRAAITSMGGGITELTGDVTAGPGSGPEAATLAASGVTAATYGDSTHVAQIAVDAKGRVTSASNVAVSGGGSTVSALACSGVTAVANVVTVPATCGCAPYAGVAATTFGSGTVTVGASDSGYVNIGCTASSGTMLLEAWTSTSTATAAGGVTAAVLSSPALPAGVTPIARVQYLSGTPGTVTDLTIVPNQQYITFTGTGLASDTTGAGGRTVNIVGGSGTSITAAPPYLTIGGTKYLGANLYPVTVPSTSGWSMLNTIIGGVTTPQPGSISASTNGVMMLDVPANAQGWAATGALTAFVGIEGVWQHAQYLDLNSIDGDAWGVWAWDSANNRVWAIAQHYTMDQIDVISAVWAGTTTTIPASIIYPMVSQGLHWNTAGTRSPYRLSISGSTIVASLSFDGGATWKTWYTSAAQDNPPSFTKLLMSADAGTLSVYSLKTF